MTTEITPELVRKRRSPFADVMMRLAKSPLAMFGLAIIFVHLRGSNLSVQPDKAGLDAHVRDTFGGTLARNG